MNCARDTVTNSLLKVDASPKDLSSWSFRECSTHSPPDVLAFSTEGKPRVILNRVGIGTASEQSAHAERGQILCMGAIALNCPGLDFKLGPVFGLANRGKSATYLQRFAPCEPPLQSAVSPLGRSGTIRRGVVGQSALDVLPSESIPRGTRNRRSLLGHESNASS